MTRTDIEKDYTVVNSRITSPGKFEGEMVYVPYYWEVFLEGFADRDYDEVIGFNILPEDKKMFPELRGRRTVKLLLRSDGFVCEI